MNEQEKLEALQQAATVAEGNELSLHRRLSPYLDAEIENRDAEIEKLKARIAELEGTSEASEAGVHGD